MSATPTNATQMNATQMNATPTNATPTPSTPTPPGPTHNSSLLGLPAPSSLQGTPARPIRQSLPVQVAEIVTDAVLAGEHPPGSTLPSERDLARQLGVNRTSLRQALARLEQAGLVASRQGIGTVVLDPLEATDGAVVLRALVAAGPEVVGEVLEVRQALASLAGRSAATRATPAQREELVRRFDHACRCDGAPALQAAELAFFSVLVVSTGNRPLTAMMKWLERLYTATSSVFVDAFSDADAVLRDLRPVLDAVVSADPDSAERAVRDYASKSGTRLQWSVLRRSPEPAGPVPV